MDFRNLKSGNDGASLYYPDLESKQKMKILEALGALKSGVTFFGQDWKKVSCKSRFFRDFFAEKLKNPLILLNPEKNLKKIL